MKIVIRSRYINTFLVGFKSFLTFYPERIKNLIVQIQSDKDDLSFIAASKKFGFDLKIIKYDPNFHGNMWANMIYQSLQYPEVISMDDDIIFLKSGFFDFIDILKSNKSEILGFKCFLNSGEIVLHSHLFYVNSVNINKNDFLTKNKVLELYDGNNIALFGNNNKNKIRYIDDDVKMKNFPFLKNYCQNEYYAHVGGVSCLWHEIINFSKEVKIV